MQNGDSLNSQFYRIVSLYERGSWRHGPIRATNLRLTSPSGPEEIPFESLERLVDYAQDKGVLLDIQGGGIGCFDIVLGSDEAKGELLEDLILHDQHFKVLLAEINVNIARVRLNGGYRTYACHTKFHGGIITNRKHSQSSDRGNVTGCFLNDPSEHLSFAIAEFHVLEPNRKPKDTWNSLWKIVTLGIGQSTYEPVYEVAAIDIVDSDKFISVIKGINTSSLLVSVHGYANDFNQAVSSFAKFVGKTRVYRNHHFPILFSWPSPGDPLSYFSDTDRAANSQDLLATAIDLVASADKSRVVNVMAHSHGSKMAIEMGRDRANRNDQPKLGRMIFIEPDVNADYMCNKIPLLLKCALGITVYHSKNDWALAISKTIFESARAGRDGFNELERSFENSDIEIIDATKVAKGLTKHAPHVDSIKVVYDIRDTLNRKTPVERDLNPQPSLKCWYISQ